MNMQQRNVMEYLDKIVLRYPDKVAFANEDPACDLTFGMVYQRSRAIGSLLEEKGYYAEPVVVFMKKHPNAISAFFGCVYGGCYYVPIDEEMPKFRTELILQTLNPRVMICDDETREIAVSMNFEGEILLYSEAITAEINDDALNKIRDKQIDTDPIYIVFTSGSTGIPKGVVACHRSVIDYIENLSEVLEFDHDTRFANQTPLYFDACLKELYPTLKFGATTVIVPKSLFMFPIKLVEFLNEHKVNTVCWVVSALTMISSFKTFEKIKPEYLKNIAFGSEVFPIKQLNIWREALPDCKFTNLYGPTEATGMCCYFKVDRKFDLNESVPIGGPFKNTRILLLNEKNELCKDGEEGEICVVGTSLTIGYYKNFEKTNEVFVQNPLNKIYPELIYRTGDIGKRNDRGELLFVSRKDFQIKHMGHRIELGEIEVNVNNIDQIRTCCCVYDKEKDKIKLYYVGDIETGEIISILKEKLPRYMIPNKAEKLDVMPLTANGKIDRKKLASM